MAANSAEVSIIITGIIREVGVVSIIANNNLAARRKV
jgi:hypothetical protein